MRFMLLSTIVACVALNLSCAAADGTSAPSANGTAAPDPRNEIICKVQPPPLGTRIGGRRICGTRAEWEAQENATRTFVGDSQMRPAVNPGSGHDNMSGPGGH